MSATEQDQKRAVALLRAAAADGLIQDTEPRHQPAMVERIASALAEERERARAPFLEVALFVEQAVEGSPPGRVGIYSDIATRIRRAAEDGQ